MAVIKVLVALFLASAPVIASDATPVTDTSLALNLPAIDSADLRSLLDADANLVVVDVRDEKAFQAGHLPFAVHYPWAAEKSDDSKAKLARLLQDGPRPVVIYGGEPLELSEIAKWVAARNTGPVSIYLAGASGWAQYEEGFLEIEWEGLWSLLTRGNPIVLDVRGAARYAAGHIPGAIQVEPRKSWTSYLKQPPIDAWRKSGRAIVTYCTGAACGESRKLAGQLSKAGLSPVYQFPGGYEEWEERTGCLAK